MSHSSYTASERRGILAIAIIALLIIGLGAGMTVCNRNTADAENIPVVVDHPEMIDTIAVKANREKKKKDNTKKKTSNSSSKKTNKEFRRRSPLDEPVN